MKMIVKMMNDKGDDDTFLLINYEARITYKIRSCTL